MGPTAPKRLHVPPSLSGKQCMAAWGAPEQILPGAAGGGAGGAAAKPAAKHGHGHGEQGHRWSVGGAPSPEASAWRPGHGSARGRGTGEVAGKEGAESWARLDGARLAGGPDHRGAARRGSGRRWHGSSGRRPPGTRPPVARLAWTSPARAAAAVVSTNRGAAHKRCGRRGARLCGLLGRAPSKQAAGARNSEPGAWRGRDDRRAALLSSMGHERRGCRRRGTRGQ